MSSQTRAAGSPATDPILRRAAVLTGVLALLLALDRVLIPIRILTPHEGQEPLSPLYAIWSPVLSLWLAPALAAGLTVVLVGHRLPRRPNLWPAAIGALLLLLAAIGLALVRGGPPALTAPFVIYAGEDYTADLPLALAAPGRFLTSFVDLMPRLSLHGCTHPPGFTLFLAAAVRLLGGAPLARALLVIVLGALAMLPLHALACRRYGPEAARLAVALYAGVPAVLLFTATSLDALLPLPSLVALDLADRGRRGAPWWGLAAGATIALVTFFSFSGLALLPIGAAVLLGPTVATGDERNGGTRSAGAVRCGWLLAGFLFPYLLLRLAAGFDMAACFMRGRANLAIIEEQMKGRGAHPARDFVYTSFGNLLAFAVGLGSPVVILVTAAIRRQWRAVHRQRRRWRADGLLIGLMVVLAGMTLSYVYLLEVERIWLFLVGPLVVVAGAELARRQPSPRLIAQLLALLVGQALVMETLLYTFW